MKCDSIWELLSVYADAETTPQEAMMVESHIAECSECARDLEFMKSASMNLSALDEVEPPINLRESILSATINRPTILEQMRDAISRTFVFTPVRVAGLGAAAVITVIALGMHQQGTNPAAYHPLKSGSVAAGTFNVAVPDIKLPVKSVENIDRKHVAVKLNVPAKMVIASSRISSSTVNPNASLSWVPKAESVRRTGEAVYAGARIAASSDMRFATPSSVDTNIGSRNDVTPSLAAAPEPNLPATHTAVMPTVVSVPSAAQVTGKRTILNAGPSHANPDQVATLGELKHSLRSKESEWETPTAMRNLKNREIGVDVVRSSW